MRSWSRTGWTRWCAGIVLALMALSMLHAAVPHHASQRDCFACKALHAPGVAQAAAGPGAPADQPSRIVPVPPSGPLTTVTCYLKPLRAPPVLPAV